MSGYRRARRRAWVTRRKKRSKHRKPRNNSADLATRILGRLVAKRARRDRMLYGSPLAVNPHPYWSTR